MNDTRRGKDLVMTEADLPPGIDAPSPQSERDRIAGGQTLSPDVEREIRRLADRVGGMTHLRELVTELAHANR
jgi:hypothetical protein